MPYTLLSPTLYSLETSATYASFTSVQDISTPTNGQAWAMPPNTITTVGQVLHLHAAGVFSTTATPNLTLGFYYGGAGGVTLAATAATTTASGVTNVPWILDYWGVIQTVGSSGTIIGEGYCMFGTSATAMTLIPIPNATPQTALTINTTLPKTIGVAGTWSASSASNTITVQQYTVMLLN